MPFAVAADAKVDALKRPVHSFGASFAGGDFNLGSSSSDWDALSPPLTGAGDPDSSVNGWAMATSPEF